jgi:hypothetical protein
MEARVVVRFAAPTPDSEYHEDDALTVECRRDGGHSIADRMGRSEQRMGRWITLEVPEEVLSRAERLAALAHRDVTEVLAEAVSAVLPPMDALSSASCPIYELPDDEVLRLADLRLDAESDRRLSGLLDRQQAGILTESERTELSALIQVYGANWLRQAEALAEAVRRGLREPLSS